MAKVIDLRRLGEGKDEEDAEAGKPPSFLERWDDKEEEKDEEKEAPAEEEATEKEEKDAGILISESSERKGRLPGRVFWGGTGAGLAALIAVLALLSTVFARVTLILRPALEQISVEDVLVAFDTSVSKTLVSQRVLPAELFRFSRTERGEFSATGEKFVEEKARGTARIYNEFSSSPQALVATTRFLAPDGTLYRLSRAVTVPGAKVEDGKIVPQYIEAELAADTIGESGNKTGEIRLIIPGFKGSSKYEGFYGVAPAGFAGGFRGKARVVSEDDLKKAQEEITKNAYQLLERELAAKIPSEFKVTEGLRKIQISEIDAPRVNSPGERFTAGASALADVFAFRGGDVVELLKELILKGDTAKEFVSGSEDIQYQVRAVDFAKGRAEVLLRGTVKVKSVISQDELATLVAAKKEGSILEALKKRSELAEYRIAFFPPWLFKAPADTEKIKFKVENVK